MSIGQLGAVGIWTYYQDFPAMGATSRKMPFTALGGVIKWRISLIKENIPSSKGHTPTSADLGYWEEDRISPSTLFLNSIKG